MPIQTPGFELEAYLLERNEQWGAVTTAHTNAGYKLEDELHGIPAVPVTDRTQEGVRIFSRLDMFGPGVERGYCLIDYAAVVRTAETHSLILVNHHTKNQPSVRMRPYALKEDELRRALVYLVDEFEGLPALELSLFMYRMERDEVKEVHTVPSPL